MYPLETKVDGMRLIRETWDMHDGRILSWERCPGRKAQSADRLKVRILIPAWETPRMAELVFETVFAYRLPDDQEIFGITVRCGEDGVVWVGEPGADCTAEALGKSRFPYVCARRGWWHFVHQESFSEEIRERE